MSSSSREETRSPVGAYVETELKSLLYEQNFWYPGTFIIFKNLYKTKKKKKNFSDLMNL
jgi:hypothetical protein